MYVIEGVLAKYFQLVFGEYIHEIQLVIGACYACYECSWLIKKFVKFKEKYNIAQSILYSISQNKNGVTEEEIKCIDRVTTQLCSNLSHNQTHTLDEVCVINENIEIKIEPKNTDISDLEAADNEKQIDNDQYTDYDDDEELPLTALKELVMSNPAPNVETCFVNEPSSSVNDLESLEPIKKSLKKKTMGTLKLKSEKKYKVKSEKKLRLKAKETFYEEDIKQDKRKRPMNEHGFTEDDVALMADFIVTKLTFEEQRAEIEKRKESSNYLESPFKCDICYKGFLHTGTFKNHMLLHDANRGKECTVCKVRIRDKNKWFQHTSRHSIKYTCKSCKFVTGHRDHARKHRNWHNGVTYRCQFCNEVFNKHSSQQTHMRIKHPSEFVCDECGYSFVSQRGLKMHKTKTHRILTDDKKTNSEEKVTEKKDLYCKECDLRFSAEDAWKRHMVTSAKHRTSLDAACRHCGEIFSSEKELQSHLRVHARRQCIKRYYRYQGPPLTYPRQCELCDRMLVGRSEHWKHYQSSHKDAKYPHSTHNFICEICGKGFTVNAYLEYHRRRHADAREHACPRCGKAFHSRARLLAHAASHEPARPHACTLCGKGFKTKLALYQHVKRHAGVRRFPCQYCGKAFTTAPCLRLHVKHVHMNTPLVPPNNDT